MLCKTSIVFALLATCLAWPVQEQDAFSSSPMMFTSSESVRFERDEPLEVSTDVSRMERLADVLLESSSRSDFSSERRERDEEKLMDVFSTMESSTEFSSRAIMGSYPEELTTERSFVPMEREIQGEEPSTSVDSFGKLTGLLIERPSEQTTSESELKDEHQESKPMKKTQVLVIPGKVIETKIFADLPSKFIAVSTDKSEVHPEQLSQGSTLLLFLLAALLFCACLMASTIAIVKSSQSLKRRSRITEMEAHLDKAHFPFESTRLSHSGR